MRLHVLLHLFHHSIVATVLVAIGDFDFAIVLDTACSVEQNYFAARLEVQCVVAHYVVHAFVITSHSSLDPSERLHRNVGAVKMDVRSQNAVSPSSVPPHSPC
jgi:hypothetical protein